MTESYVAQRALWTRLTESAAVQALFSGTPADRLPLYLDFAPADAPAMYVVVANLGQTYVLTQEKAREYAEVEIDVIVTAEDRGMHGLPSATADVWSAAATLDAAIAGDLSPYATTFEGNGYEVTSDTMSGRFDATNEAGTLVRRVASRYLVRVQRIT